MPIKKTTKKPAPKSYKNSAPAWFTRMSESQQKAYLKSHPNSKMHAGQKNKDKPIYEDKESLSDGKKKAIKKKIDVLKEKVDKLPKDHKVADYEKLARKIRMLKRQLKAK